MPLLGWIVRVLIVAFILRLVLRMFRRADAPSGRRQSGKPVERAGGTLVRDPQCGTYVPMTRAVTSGHGADARHFCSVECRDRYLEGPRVPRAEGPKVQGVR